MEEKILGVADRSKLIFPIGSTKPKLWIMKWNSELPFVKSKHNFIGKRLLYTIKFKLINVSATDFFFAIFNSMNCIFHCDIRWSLYLIWPVGQKLHIFVTVFNSYTLRNDKSCIFINI